MLLRFDARFADVVGRASEPIIGQMKLAWWRDALAAAPEKRPKGEPLLGELAGLSDIALEPALQKLLDAWEMVLVDPDWSAQTLSSFAQARGDAMFMTYAHWNISNDDLALLGAGWPLMICASNLVTGQQCHLFQGSRFRGAGR
jgi:15-cis-phytoene synthase